MILIANASFRWKSMNCIVLSPHETVHDTVQYSTVQVLYSVIAESSLGVNVDCIWRTRDKMEIDKLTEGEDFNSIK